MSGVDPHTLSGGPLEYSFLKSCGIALLGEADGPFAVHRKTDQALVLFRTNERNCLHVSFEDDFALYPFELALEHSASFTVKDGEVTCVIGKATGRGSSYSEAAMRTLIAMKQVDEK